MCPPICVARHIEIKVRFLVEVNVVVNFLLVCSCSIVGLRATDFMLNVDFWGVFLDISVKVPLCVLQIGDNY